MELDPVDRITVGAVGEPGERTFYLQARRGTDLVTIVVEKQQVQLLSATVVDMLSRLGTDVEVEVGEHEMELEQPLVPEWRAARIAVGYAEERDLFMLEAEELEEEDEEAELGGQARFWATREQMLALARHGIAVAAAGRPTCEFCGNPMDPEGHVCPAMNGQGRLGEA
ncbi:MAG TPA: DUF3090 family protein [Actinomycetota bacterium]